MAGSSAWIHLAEAAGTIHMVLINESCGLRRGCGLVIVMKNVVRTVCHSEISSASSAVCDVKVGIGVDWRGW